MWDRAAASEQADTVQYMQTPEAPSLEGKAPLNSLCLTPRGDSLPPSADEREGQLWWEDGG